MLLCSLPSWFRDQYVKVSAFIRQGPTPKPSDTMKSLKIVWGTAGSLWRDHGPEVLDIITEAGIEEIDCAQLYRGSEETAGKIGAGKRVKISTKEASFGTAALGLPPPTTENVIQRGLGSLKLMQSDQMDILYLHGPDRQTPIEDTVAGVNELYNMGKIRRFGLSNYLPSEVEEVVRVCKEKGYVMPTVYEGNYSPVARIHEDLLFPILKQHGITYYCYSPLAGGFLARTRAQIEAGEGRFSKNSTNVMMQIYSTLYVKPSYLDALDVWENISTTSGVPKPELALRWVAYHSPLDRERGDAMIIGASSLEQLRQTIAAIKKGPLPVHVARQVDGVWDICKHESCMDNINLNQFEVKELPKYEDYKPHL